MSSSTLRTPSLRALRFGVYSAVCILLGVIFSGPLALLAVALIHAQPRWEDARVFAHNYHPVQTLPFFGGFFLVGGFLGILGSLHAQATQSMRARTSSALLFGAAFSGIVFFNYAVQTTFVPALVQPYSVENASVVAAFTMANPRSLGWSLEMWGYALLGVGTWLVAPVFPKTQLGRASSWAFVANGPLSIMSAVWTAWKPGWEMTTFGLGALIVWNALVVLMATLALLAFRAQTRRFRDSLASSETLAELHSRAPEQSHLPV